MVNNAGTMVGRYNLTDMQNEDFNKIFDLNAKSVYFLIKHSLNEFKKDTISLGKELAISMNLVAGDHVILMSTANLQTPFGSLPLQEKFTISSIFTTGLVEFDQNVVFMPFENAKALFELSDKDINLEIYLEKPEQVELIKKKVQK